MVDDQTRTPEGAPVFPQRSDTTVEPSVDPSPYPSDTQPDAVNDWNRNRAFGDRSDDSDAFRDSRGVIVRQRILSYDDNGAPIYDDDSDPVRDFTTLVQAEAQAEALGGVVEAVGVAFHVREPRDGE